LYQDSFLYEVPRDLFLPKSGWALSWSQSNIHGQPIAVLEKQVAAYKEDASIYNEPYQEPQNHPQNIFDAERSKSTDES
jgi:hypothetical protein